jgi:hypothetical protein
VLLDPDRNTAGPRAVWKAKAGRPRVSGSHFLHR